MKIHFSKSILIFLLSVLLLVSFTSTLTAKQQAANLVIKNANIYTVDAAFSKSAAIAVNGSARSAGPHDSARDHRRPYAPSHAG